MLSEVFPLRWQEHFASLFFKKYLASKWRTNIHQRNLKSSHSFPLALSNLDLPCNNRFLREYGTMFLNWSISSPGQAHTAPNRACLYNLLPLPCEPRATAALPITSLQHALANAQPHFYFLFSHYLTFTAYPKWIIWSFCFFILYYLFSWVGPTTRKYPSWTRTHLKLSSNF